MEINYETFAYRGKHYTVPVFSEENPIVINPKKIENFSYDRDSQIIKDLNTPFDIAEFKTARTPLSFGKLDETVQHEFNRETNMRVLDMPIKFPGTNYRIPRELEQFASLIERVAHIEETINPEHADYFCYLTVETKSINAGTLQREAPVHVDGFIGGRWSDPVPINHSYIVGNALPTVFYPQPFLLDMLDIEKHDVFWEMNRQVAMTNSHYATTFQPFELTLMNAYCAHRGDVAPVDMERTWVRLSYEVREYDRLGNAHNPLFEYNWEMVTRDIEQLNLVAYDPTCDPTLRVFPWQKPNGTPQPKGLKTMPNLQPNYGGTKNDRT